MNPYESIDWMLNDSQHDGKPLVSRRFKFGDVVTVDGVDAIFIDDNFNGWCKVMLKGCHILPIRIEKVEPCNGG